MQHKVVYVGVIDVAIQVDQSVPELGHLPQFYPFFLVYDAIFFEHFKLIFDSQVFKFQ